MGIRIGMADRRTAELDGDAELCLLVVVRGALARHTLATDGGPIVLGRGHEADIDLDEPEASSRHAVIHGGSPPTLEDLGSANGTIIAGRRLQPGEVVELAEGDAVQIGGATLIVQRVGRLDIRVLSHDEFLRRARDACDAGPPLTIARIAIREAGDELLAQLLRPGDLVGTAASGEYELLLAEPADIARVVVRRTVTQLERAGLAVRTGIASFPRDGRDPEALLMAAGAELRGDDSGRGGEPLIVREGVMREVYPELERVARSQLTVVITGETGVGKEIMAELVHRHSPRADAPFLCLNCAAFPEQLLESELFGHDRDASHTKPGVFEVAHGGTVFLDEIGEMPLALQARLLRVLESRQVVRVGALAPIAIDVRFVAATNRDLEADVRDGRFREDLYYRLNAYAMRVPPLRERREEIPHFARTFRDAACVVLGRKPVPAWSPEAMAALAAHDWPGNLRELRNVIERACVVCTQDVIGIADLPEAVTRVTAPIAGDELRERIEDALARTGGNQTKAAKLLGIARNTLTARMKAFGITKKGKTDRS
jgi:DNA-binding NtrC family response regulator